VKQILANTKLKVDKLLNKLDKETGYVGFDTEVSGPLLRDVDFVDITHSCLLGLSIAFEDEECYYLPFRHKGNNISFVQLHQVATRLQQLAVCRKLWAHNAKFDHQVMIREGYPMVGMLDSMVAAWLGTGKNNGLGLKGLAASLVGRQSPEFDPSIAFKSGAEALDYACQDALNTLQIGLYFLDNLDWHWFLHECDFAFLLAKMKLQGIAIDREGLHQIRREAYDELSVISDSWDELCPLISINSSSQLQELFTEGTWVEYGKTKSGKFQTGKEAMVYQLEHANGNGAHLAELRLAYQEVAKVVSTYTDGLIECSLQYADKKLHPDLHQFGTVTGRLSSSNPNIQNQPARGNWSEKVKACFVPDPGAAFTSADYSQIELRYFANYCGGKLLQSFNEGKDLHQVTGDVLGVDRQLGKTINFGFLLYGGGRGKLSRLLKVSEDTAQGLLERLQEGFPEIELWRSRVVSTVASRGPVPWCKTLAGRVRYIPELNPAGFERERPEAYSKAAKLMRDKYGWMSEEKVKKAIYSRGCRLVVNYLVQGGSRDLLVIGMNAFDKAVVEDVLLRHGVSVIATVHDEVLTMHPDTDKWGEQVRSVLRRTLEGAGEALGLRVPLVAIPKTGKNWFECK
jgi:DNA polymerase I